MPVGLAIVHCARRGIGIGSRKRAANPSHAACTCPWYPTGRVPAAAAVLSPPPRGEGASGTPWAHFEWGNWGKLGITGNVGNAAATASRLYWSRLELTTPLCPREPAEPPPVNHRAERRQLRGARQLRARCEGLFPKFGQFRETYGFVVRKKHAPVHILSVPVHMFRRLLPTGRDRLLEGGGVL